METGWQAWNVTGPEHGWGTAPGSGPPSDRRRVGALAGGRGRRRRPAQSLLGGEHRENIVETECRGKARYAVPPGRCVTPGERPGALVPTRAFIFPSARLSIQPPNQPFVYPPSIQCAIHSPPVHPSLQHTHFFDFSFLNIDNKKYNEHEEK